MLKDRFGRPLLNFRIAVTQNCNLNCVYCHREGEERKDTRQTEMTVDEIVKIAEVAVNLGISKVKLTGGEPLTRKDIPEIVEGIAAIKGLEDLAITTNGTLLQGLAEELRRRGLKRVNINIPSLNAEKYAKLTGGDLRHVLNGIKAAVKAGIHPVKLNMLLLKGVNTDEIWRMAHFAEQTGTILQLIELEPINLDKEFYVQYHQPLDGIAAELERKALKIEARRYMHNRLVYHLPNVKIELVPPIENTEFCAHCTRIRLTSDGKLKTCLMRNDDLIDVLTPLRNGASPREIAELFKLANQKRRPYYTA
ncbi:GTP 3',8-cyclase MoaA [Candidatus Bathyarchaeota archaeon]|nr:MAG: GTP 3',8-cyclase MoaA [Candidatus Bathyarchaeota archaeon]